MTEHTPTPWRVERTHDLWVEIGGEWESAEYEYNANGDLVTEYFCDGCHATRYVAERSRYSTPMAGGGRA